MKRKLICILLAGTALALATPAEAVRPLGPHPIGKHKAKPASGNTQDLLRQAQLRIAQYAKPAAPPPAAATALPANQINIPNLPSSAPGPAPASLGRSYTQEELTRTWAPYTYP